MLRSTSLSKNLDQLPRPLPKFQLYQQVRISKDVYDGKEQPYVVGYEWADDNRRVKVKSNTYLYHIKAGNGPWFLASEEELLEWERTC